MALEKAQSEGHALEEKPVLLTDNGAGFAGEVMAKYLKARGVRHIFGAPYHPQTKGKVERFNRTLKEKINLWVYGTPDDLQAAIDKMIEEYNETPHEALKMSAPTTSMREGRKRCWNGGPRSSWRHWPGVMRIIWDGCPNRKFSQVAKIAKIAEDVHSKAAKARLLRDKRHRSEIKGGRGPVRTDD